MSGTPVPEPRQGFVEAYEFFSKELARDPKDFSIEWRAPQNPKFKAAKAGRWQSLLDKNGGPSGNFIAHGLPPSQTVELRVLSTDVPSDWVAVETKALPDPLLDVHSSDPFGNPLGGIKGLCKGWVLDQSNISLGSSVEKGMRCLRCGCATFRHAKPDAQPPLESKQQLDASAKPKVQPKVSQPKATASAQPKTAASTQPKAVANGYPKAAPSAQPKAADSKQADMSFEDELNLGRPRNDPSMLPAPYVRAAFQNSLELHSEFLATDPPEFKVEWARIAEEGGEPGEPVVGTWANTGFRTRSGEDGQKMGLFMLDNLPAGERIAVRLRDGERAGPWMRLRTRPAPEGEPEAAGRVAPGAAACGGFAGEDRCLRCGRTKGLHRREEPSARRARAGLAAPGPAGAGAGAGGPEPWRPEELRGVQHEGAAGHPMPLAPGLRAVACGDVELVTHFDGSNGELLEGFSSVRLAKVDSEGKPKSRKNLDRLHVVLRPDPSDGTESTGRKRWFYFGVRAAEGVDPVALKGKKIRMVVNGMSDMTDLFNLDGHRPFYRNVPHQVEWLRVREPSRFVCRYEGGGGRGSNVGDGGKFTISTGDAIPDNSPQEDDSVPIAKLAEIEGCLVEDGMLAVASSGSGAKRKKMRRCHIAWDFVFDYEGGTTYFAFSEPFGYEDLQEYLGRLERFLTEGGGPGAELPDFAPRPPTLPAGVEAEVLVLEGPHMGAQVKCSINGVGTKVGTFAVHVPACPPVLQSGGDFPAVPLEVLRNVEGNHAADWRPRLGTGVYFHRGRLCGTADGRRVDLLTVSQAESGGQDERNFIEAPSGELATCLPLAETPPRDFPGRRVVFVSARVHPGETPAQFAFFGFFQFIISNDPRAELLRRSFVFKLVPMLNPDGVGRGHTRANAKGLDLNRGYSDPKPEDHEGVFHVLELLAHWSKEKRLLFYLDMHAHAHTRGCILYGNALKGPAQVWNIGFAHLCQMNSPHFDVDGSEFPPKTDKEHGGESLNSGRACVAALCKLYHAYTLECHYSTGRLTRPVPEPPGLEGQPKHPGVAAKTFRQVRFSGSDFEGVGEGIAVSILDLHGRNPHSRVHAKRGQSLDGILQTVAKAIKAESAYGSGRRPQAPPASEGTEEAAQLWRVVHEQVIARDRPALTGRMVEMYSKGSLLLVADKVDNSPWVKLAVPGGRLGGRLNSVLSGNTEVFMLTDGSQKGLGVLLEPTGLWVRIRPQQPARRATAEPQGEDSEEYSVAVPSSWDVEARQLSSAPAALQFPKQR